MELLMAKVLRVSLIVFLVLAACNQQRNAASPVREESLGTSSSDADGTRSDSLAKVATSSRAYAEDLRTAQLVYNAELELTVRNLKGVGAHIKQTVEKFGGYVSESTAESDQHLAQGTVTARVPTKHYKQALAALRKIGKVRKLREWTDDVTEEYIDVTTRIANQRALEARLLMLVQKNTASLKDLVDVENKLSEVRTAIETQEGRLRFLKNRLSYSTISIKYDEPEAAWSDQHSVFYPLTWAVNQLGMVFFGSLGVFLLVICGSLPWVLVIYGLIRWIRSRRKLKSKLNEPRQAP